MKDQPQSGTAAAAQGAVILVISTLGAGGAERVLTTMASWWARRGRPVFIVTLADAEPESFYPLEPAVVRIGIGGLADSRNLGQALRGNVARVAALRSAIAGLPPGPVIGFGSETNCLVVLALLGSGRRVLVCERCDPRFIPRRRPWRWLRRALYPLAGELVVQSREAAAFFSRPAHVVPNPVSVPVRERACAAGEPAVDALRPPFVAAMGRLTAQKGFADLIAAFARVAAAHPDWSLRIFGEGPLRPALEAQVRDAGLDGRVLLPGLTRTPFAVLRQADLFVLSSHFEGFPNVLCEAMLCAAPVIATDCPSGPAEIVRDGVDGRLVPAGDVDALAAAMDELMGDAPRRRRLGERAPDIAQRFSLETVMAAWDGLLDAGGGGSGDREAPRRVATTDPGTGAGARGN